VGQAAVTYSKKILASSEQYSRFASVSIS